MQTSLSNFEARNTQVLAISADTPADLAEKVAPKGFTFPLLADPDLVAIDAYGLRHEGGNPFGGDIARPAVFVIDEEGNIRWKALTENWRVRLRPEQILAELPPSS